MSNAYVESCRGKAFAVLFLVFLGGALTGGIAMRVYDGSSAVATNSPAERYSKQPSLAVEHLRDELSLDAQQVAQVEGILDECIMKEADLFTELAITRSAGRERILDILNHDQRRKFEDLLAKVSDQ